MTNNNYRGLNPLFLTDGYKLVCTCGDAFIANQCWHFDDCPRHPLDMWFNFGMVTS